MGMNWSGFILRIMINGTKIITKFYKHTPILAYEKGNFYDFFSFAPDSRICHWASFIAITRNKLSSIFSNYILQLLTMPIAFLIVLKDRVKFSNDGKNYLCTWFEK